MQGGQSVANVQSTAVAPPSQGQHSVQQMGIPEHQHIRGMFIVFDESETACFVRKMSFFFC